MTYITLTIEPLDEGGYVATSKEVQGLVAQGKTMDEVIGYARDIAKTLLDERKKLRSQVPSLIVPRQQELVVAV